MRRSAVLSLPVLAVVVGGCGGSISGTSGPVTAVPVQWRFGGLVELSSIALLPPEHTSVPYTGNP